MRQQENQDVQVEFSVMQMAVIEGFAETHGMSVDEALSTLMTQGLKALYLSLPPQQRPAVLRRVK